MSCEQYRLIDLCLAIPSDLDTDDLPAQGCVVDVKYVATWSVHLLCQSFYKLENTLSICLCSHLYVASLQIIVT